MTQSRSTAPLPAVYTEALRKGYFDERGYVREEFIARFARAVADSLEEGGMTRSLLRNFYGEVSTVRYLLRSGQPWEAVRHRVAKLEAFASNAISRQNNKAPPLFGQFIAENVRASKSDHDFLDGFSQHFECVVLYFKGR